MKSVIKDELQSQCSVVTLCGNIVLYVMTIPLPQTLSLMDHTSLNNGSVTGYTKLSPVVGLKLSIVLRGENVYKIGSDRRQWPAQDLMNPWCDPVKREHSGSAITRPYSQIMVSLRHPSFPLCDTFLPLSGPADVCWGEERGVTSHRWRQFISQNTDRDFFSNAEVNVVK